MTVADFIILNWHIPDPTSFLVIILWQDHVRHGIWHLWHQTSWHHAERIRFQWSSIPGIVGSDGVRPAQIYPNPYCSHNKRHRPNSEQHVSIFIPGNGKLFVHEYVLWFRTGSYLGTGRQKCMDGTRENTESLTWRCGSTGGQGLTTVSC